jgi:predicted DNA-binding transcriptional regulator AlpA
MADHTATDRSSTTQKSSGCLPASFDNLPDTGYLRQAQLIPHVVPISSATLWRGVVSGAFPRPVKLSERVTAWRVGDIRQWMDSKAGGAK